MASVNRARPIGPQSSISGQKTSESLHQPVGPERRRQEYFCADPSKVL
jgi:hypothetical protein